jgi:hypothetical protein
VTRGEKQRQGFNWAGLMLVVFILVRSVAQGRWLYGVAVTVGGLGLGAAMRVRQRSRTSKSTE